MMPHENVSMNTYAPRAGVTARVVSLWKHMRRLEAEGHNTAVRQLGEIACLKILRDIGPAYYLRAGLYRREISWKEKLDYIAGAKYERLVHSVNAEKDDHLTRNKLETYKILSAHGIPTPEVYGLVEGKSGWTWDGEVLGSHEDLVALVSRRKIDTVVFKFVTGTRGIGFYKAKIDAGGDPAVTIEPDGEKLPLREFWGRLRDDGRFNGYFCQAAIDQDPVVARFNPWSVNTVRTWMVRSPEGDWDMRVADLRMGIGKTAVDNVSRGGVAPKIDIATGRLSAGILRRVDRPVYAKHPVTGEQIEGVIVPMWPEVKALCKRTAALFPSYRLLSVDVAFGLDGPLVVELGGSPDEMQAETGEGAYALLCELVRRRKVEEAW
jgi:hypothetical protein